MIRSALVRALTFPLALTVSCCSEISYDPSYRGDSPSSQGSEYRTAFHYTESEEATYTLDDLSEDMPLAKLLDIALYNNPSTRASWYAARAAAFGYHASLSSYYPLLLYSGDLTAQKTNGGATINGGGAVISSDSTDTVTGAGSSVASVSATNSTTLFDNITASYLLFDFGGRDSQAQAALYLLDQANWQHNLVMQQVMLSVITTYTNYIGNKALVAANEEDLKDALVALDAATKMRAAGLSTLTDVLSAQSTVEQTRLNLEQARGAEKTAFAELLIILGLPPEARICAVGLPEKLPVVEISGNICALIALAKQRRPDIGAAIAAVKEQEALLGVAYSAGLPTLTLNASSTNLRFLKPNRPTIRDQSISVGWSYPIFQGYYFVNTQKQIMAQIQEALADLDITVNQVSTGVVVNYYAFQTAEAGMPAAEALLEFSERAYRGMLSQYKVGTSSIIDVLNALTTLSNARAQKVINKVQWAASLANLSFAVGVLEETSGGWQDEPPQRLYNLRYTNKKSSK